MRRWELPALIIVFLILAGSPAAAFLYNDALHAGHSAREITLEGSAAAGWDSDVVRVRQGERIRLRVTSEDVLHGFALSSHDVVMTKVYPGRYTIAEFTAGEPGEYAFVCVIPCGKYHATMRGTLVVEPTA